MLQRFLDPATLALASISGLDLVARTVVDGFVAGLHPSPDFGLSQEFAEYRAPRISASSAPEPGEHSNADPLLIPPRLSPRLRVSAVSREPALSRSPR